MHPHELSTLMECLIYCSRVSRSQYESFKIKSQRRCRLLCCIPAEGGRRGTNAATAAVLRDLYLRLGGDINNKEARHPPVLQSRRDIWKRLITTHCSSKARMWLGCQTSEPKWDQGICLCSSLCVTPEEIQTTNPLIKIYCEQERRRRGSYGV